MLNLLESQHEMNLFKVFGEDHIISKEVVILRRPIDQEAAKVVGQVLKISVVLRRVAFALLK